MQDGCSLSCATLSQASRDLCDQTPGSLPGGQVPGGTPSTFPPPQPMLLRRGRGRTFYTKDLGSDPGSAHSVGLVRGLAQVVPGCGSGVSAAPASGCAALVQADSGLLLWLVQQGQPSAAYVAQVPRPPGEMVLCWPLQALLGSLCKPMVAFTPALHLPGPPAPSFSRPQEGCPLSGGEMEIPHPHSTSCQVDFAADEFGISNMPLVKLFLFKIFSLSVKF